MLSLVLFLGKFIGIIYGVVYDGTSGAIDIGIYNTIIS